MWRRWRATGLHRFWSAGSENDAGVGAFRPARKGLYEAYSSTQKEAQRPPNPRLRKRPYLVRFLQRIIDREPVGTSRSR